MKKIKNWVLAATLILGAGTTLTASKGIEVSSDNNANLTIEGPGTLVIDACAFGESGIGAEKVGELTINGGIIDVAGGTSGEGNAGAAIGGDFNNISGGRITITGGVVNAKAGLFASAIGGGYSSLGDGYGVCGDNIVSPVFSGVTIDKTDRSYDNGAAGNLRVRFVGTYSGLTFDADDKSILFMGGESKLHYHATGASIGVQRAYFKIGEDGAASNARITAFNIDLGEGELTTGIVNVEATTSFIMSQSSFYYSLDGRKLLG